MGKGGIENRVEQMTSDVKSYFAALRVGGVYDSRVGAASGGSDEDSDTALAATLTAGWQVPMEGDFGLRLDYSGYADFHQDFDEYDIIDQSISLEPQYTLGQMTFSVPVAFNYAMEDGDTDYNKYTASPTLTYLFPDNEQAVAVYAIGSLIDDRDDPLEDEFGNLLYDSLGDTLLDEDAQALGAGCAYLLFFDGGSRIRLSLDYQHSVYDARVIDYDTVSLSQNDREDDIVVAGLDAQYQLTDVFGIYANYSFIHSNSNVSLYEYDQNIVEAGVALRF